MNKTIGFSIPCIYRRSHRIGFSNEVVCRGFQMYSSKEQYVSQKETWPVYILRIILLIFTINGKKKVRNVRKHKEINKMI